MKIFLDESGDLGWKFGAPYRAGGSSRYLTLAFMFLPVKHKKLTEQIIKNLYATHKWKGEKKASKAKLHQKIGFCTDAVDILKNYTDIKIDTITVNKTRVQNHIRSDANKLYNYMSGLVVPDNVGDYKNVEFIPDKRTIKVKSGNSLADYLQIKLWFDYGYETVISDNPSESHSNYNLQFIDWIAHCVWLKFEDNIEAPASVLESHVKIRRLFFP